MTRRALIFGLLVGGLVGLWFVAREQFALERLIEHEQTLRGWLADAPRTSLAAGFGIYVLASLVPGTTGKAIITGWIFGFWAGLLIVNLGLTVAAVISFFVARHLLRDLVAARLGPRLRRADAALVREGPRWLFFARILHAPFWVTNHVMGATRISPRGFWWSTQLGLLPGNMVFVYAGAAAPTLGELSEDGWWTLLSPELLVAFVAVTVLPLAMPRAATWMARRWALSRASRLAGPDRPAKLPPTVSEEPGPPADPRA